MRDKAPDPLFALKITSCRIDKVDTAVQRAHKHGLSAGGSNVYVPQLGRTQTDLRDAKPRFPQFPVPHGSIPSA